MKRKKIGKMLSKFSLLVKTATHNFLCTLYTLFQCHLLFVLTFLKVKHTYTLLLGKVEAPIVS